MMTSKGEGNRVGIVFHKRKSVCSGATQLLLGIEADANPHVPPTISYVRLLRRYETRLLMHVLASTKLRGGRQNWFNGLGDDDRSTNPPRKLCSSSICDCLTDHPAKNLFQKLLPSVMRNVKPPVRILNVS